MEEPERKAQDAAASPPDDFVSLEPPLFAELEPLDDLLGLLDEPFSELDLLDEPFSELLELPPSDPPPSELPASDEEVLLGEVADDEPRLSVL
ncbi:MAG: hypothetical protein ACR2H3_03490 [Acidimicrobiales bacterium]